MNAIDIIILSLIVIAAVMGAVKGLVHQIGTIAALVAGILACRFFGSDVADYIVDAGSEHEPVYRTLVYALVFIVVFIGIRLVAGLFGTVLSKMHIRVIDRIGGAVFSMGACILLMSVVLNIYLALAPDDRAKFATPSKPWRTAVAKCAPKVLGYITTNS